ncbi:MAG: helix-turn-helix transcriptional regulator [Burkholderiales bacterium]|nr:helix-turn-helix transcriptional regulator [Burkholderiales bacterium]
MNLANIGKTVHHCRLQKGLSQDHLAKLAGLSRVTLNQLENGVLNEIGYNKLLAILALLELDLEPKAEYGPKNALSVAARSASTSYKHILSPEKLAEILRTGKTPQQYEPHLMAFLEELPKPVAMKAVAEAATPTVPVRKIMKHLQSWAIKWKVPNTSWA